MRRPHPRRGPHGGVEVQVPAGVGGDNSGGGETGRRSWNGAVLFCFFLQICLFDTNLS